MKGRGAREREEGRQGEGEGKGSKSKGGESEGKERRWRMEGEMVSQQVVSLRTCTIDVNGSAGPVGDHAGGKVQRNVPVGIYCSGHSPTGRRYIMG